MFSLTDQAVGLENYSFADKFILCSLLCCTINPRWRDMIIN